MTIDRRAMPVVLLALLTFGCGERKEPQGRPEFEEILLEGGVHKGPFVLGSSISVSPINAGGAPTGQVYNSQTRNDLGEFSVRIAFQGYVSVEGTGYYYNEATGELSRSLLTMRAFYEVGHAPSQAAYLNLLTHLSYDRVRALVAGGTAINGAIAQAEGELRRALAIGPSDFEPAIPGAAMNLLGGESDENAYLLAVSAVLAQAAVDLAGPQGPVDASLQELLNSLSRDLEDDGEFTAEHAQLIREAAARVDPELVRAKLQERLRASGSSAVAPDFARMLAETAPRVDPNRFTIVRHPVGVDDGVVAEPGAVLDDDAAHYPGRVVARVEIWDSPAEGRLLVAVVPDEAGSFAEVALPGADGTSERLLAPRRLWISAADRSGRESKRFEIGSGEDENGPVGTPANLVITRADLTRPDSIHGEPGAFVGESAILAVRVYERATGGEPLGTAVATPDGGFAPLAVGTSASSYPRLWAEAVDKTGNVGKRVEAAVGKAAVPTLDGGKVEIVRRGLGETDSIRGMAGAFSSVCALRGVEIHDRASGGALQASGALRPDGGFDELPIGTPDASFAQLWVAGEDKCGQRSASTEALVGRVSLPPSVEASLVTYHGRADGVADGVSAAPGAIGGTNPVRSVEIRDARCVASIVPTLRPRPDGGFDELPIGTARADTPRVCLVATNKAGLASSGILSRHVEEGLQLGSTGLVDRRGGALYSFASDIDPRLATPGLGLSLTGRTPAAALAAASSIDDVRARIAAGPETRTRASRWEVNEASRDRWGHAVAYDAARGRTVVFGGRNLESVNLGSTLEFDGTSWREIETADQPAPRLWAAMAYDEARQRVVLFGGYAASDFNDTWEYDGTNWYRIPVAGPGFGAYGAMAYDPVRGVIVAFSGIFGRSWQYDGIAWTQMTVASEPPARDRPLMAFDRGRGRMVLFGGKSGIQSRDDTWELDDSGWSLVPTQTTPGALDGPTMVYDSLRGEMLLFGGGSDSQQSFTWSYDGSDWTPIAFSGPRNRQHHGMSFHAATGETIIFGGVSPGWDTWSFDGATWTDRRVRPAQMRESALGYDPGTRSTVLYAKETWVFSDGSWREVTPANGGPRLDEATIVYDSWSKRLVLVGYSAENSGWALQTWAFENETWVRIPTTNTPSFGRSYAGTTQAVFDDLRGRLVLYGGWRSPSLVGETYELFDGRWTRKAQNRYPPPRGRHAMAFDPVRGLTFVFGGDTTATNPVNLSNDLWSFDGEGWGLDPIPAGPPARMTHAMTFDPSRGRILMGGGSGATGGFSDTWELGTSWTPIAASNAKPFESTPFVYDGAVGGVVQHTRETRVLQRSTPHPRYAAQLAGFQLDPRAAPTSVEITWVGSGSGEVDGAPVNQLDLYLWNAVERTWTTLATGDAAESDPAVRSTLILVPDDIADHVAEGRIWILAVAPAAYPGGSVAESVIATDYVGMSAAYLLD
ncbi:Kelch repeat-containing protein [Vulgatibacter incomptus]|uniref:Ig-like domain/kelch domain protein n=1 Tax=Vulgatibacter incomptus TaxID=1391653 RepID=A0A0K1PHW0_9BACT|nr:kelch repeat-containing protein [Vulgatibacter incomptus]AKU93110.1 Ig-like domain/kelch domain protein [Vulgatibacter incomptus]